MQPRKRLLCIKLSFLIPCFSTAFILSTTAGQGNHRAQEKKCILGLHDSRSYISDGNRQRYSSDFRNISTVAISTTNESTQSCWEHGTSDGDGPLSFSSREHLRSTSSPFVTRLARMLSLAIFNQLQKTDENQARVHTALNCEILEASIPGIPQCGDSFNELFQDSYCSIGNSSLPVTLAILDALDTLPENKSAIPLTSSQYEPSNGMQCGIATEGTHEEDSRCFNAFFPLPVSTLGPDGTMNETSVVNTKFDNRSTGPSGASSESLPKRKTIELPVSEGKEDHDWLRKESADISNSFVPRQFKPAWFAKNSHLQTILAVTAREDTMYFPSRGAGVISQFKWDYRHRVETPDGDFFDVDWKYTKSPVKLDASLSTANATGTPIVVICHGLQSSSDSPLAKDMSIAFTDIGMNAAVINFRGCSGESCRTPMGYHLSFTDDLAFFIEETLNQRCAGSPIYLSGFSLGANVVTRYLADKGRDAYLRHNVWGAAVNAVPFDLTKARSLNEPGFNKALYGNLLLNSLRNRILDEMEYKAYNFSREELLECKRCLDFDDLVVCSYYDFEDADDYQRKSSNYNRLYDIEVPNYILQSNDDPFFLGDDTVIPEDLSRPCRVHFSEYGGHCGFIFHEEKCNRSAASFMPRELSRFIEHVHDAKIRQLKINTGVLSGNSVDRSDATWLEKQGGRREASRRQQAALASHSFVPRQFVPNWWATNPHLQTICGGLFRKATMYTNPLQLSRRTLMDPLSLKDDGKGVTKEDPITFWNERQRMETPDGDFFDVDWKYCKMSGASWNDPEVPIVLICHGLQSDSRSSLAQDLAGAFGAVGMDVACLNFRGCSGEINLTPVGYHLGYTEDLRQMVSHLNSKFPSRTLYLSGFSLGANVVTTFLADLGEAAYNYNIRGAAVNAVSFDMPRAYKNLNEAGFTKSLYGDRLLKSMIQRVEDSYSSINFSFPLEVAQKCRTIQDMENLLICPVFGFANAFDYYERTNVLNRVADIAVPHFALQALDDPFLKGQALPTVGQDAHPFRLHTTDSGGHCGYVFHSTPEVDSDHSWMPTELARFLAHLETTFVSIDGSV